MGVLKFLKAVNGLLVVGVILVTPTVGGLDTLLILAETGGSVSPGWTELWVTRTSFLLHSGSPGLQSVNSSDMSAMSPSVVTVAVVTGEQDVVDEPPEQIGL